jgi:hypothetical protein
MLKTQFNSPYRLATNVRAAAWQFSPNCQIFLKSKFWTLLGTDWDWKSTGKNLKVLYSLKFSELNYLCRVKEGNSRGGGRHRPLASSALYSCPKAEYPLGSQTCNALPSCNCLNWYEMRSSTWIDWASLRVRPKPSPIEALSANRESLHASGTRMYPLCGALQMQE